MIFTELWLKVVIAHRKSVYVSLSRRLDFKMAEGQDCTHQQRSRIPHEGGGPSSKILSGLKEDEAFFFDRRIWPVCD